MSTNPASTRSRRPSGTPTGGQFAPEAHAEPDAGVLASLDQSSAPRLIETDRGVFEVVSATVERHDPIASDGVFINRATVHLGGQPHIRAETGLASLSMEAASGGPEMVEEKVREMAAAGEKVTVLMRRRYGDIEAVEGRLVESGSGPFLLKKGSSSKGWSINDAHTRRVLAIESGYGKARDLAARFQAAGGPTLEPATFDDIPDASDADEPPSAIAAAFVLDHPGFDSQQDGRGVVFFATDRDAENGIVNGYMVCPASSGMFSEHGSMYERDIKQWGGRVAGFQAGSMSFADAANMGRQAERGDLDPVLRAIS